MSLWLECLGGFAMARDGARVELSARKARMLLGLLATSRRRTMPRRRLAALLWEASDDEQARVSLRQALAQIRRACGDGWIEADGDDLRLGAGVDTDIDAFHAALSRNDTAEAVRLYRGPFLDGLRAGSDDLDQALATERARLAGLASDAMTREMDRAGDGPEGEGVAHRLLGLDPLNEAAHRKLMQIDAARGMRGAARARFEALEASLRRDIGSTPEPETRTLYDRIRRGAAGGPARADAAPDTAPATDDAPSSGVLLLGLQADGIPDWDGLRQAAGGATEQTSGPGEMALDFTGQDLRTAASAALALAERAGTTLSFGLVPTAGPDQGDGQAIVQARRIAAMAEPGQVLVARDLAPRLGLAVDPGQRSVPLSPGGARARPAVPIIGRTSELAQIEAAIAAARAAGTGLAVHLSGEAGIGKSRLASEIARRAKADGMATATAGFDAFSPGARHFAQRLVAGLSHPPEPDAAASPVDRAIWSWLRDPQIGSEAELRMSALGPEVQQRRILDVLARALIRISADSGLLVVIEDCHWRPVGAGDLLLELMNRLQDSRVVLLMTERPHGQSLDHRLATRLRAGLVRIALAPLPHANAWDLVRAVAPGFRAPEAAIERAAGHPLFLIRLLEANWTEGDLPATVTELVQEQIERLPEVERDCLRQAAILGPAFDPADAVAIFPGAARPHPTGDLLFETETGLAFGHDIVHRAIYDSVPEETRQQWHARAAAHFRGVDPLRWADHALRAGDDAEAARAAAAAANAMFAARRFMAAFPYIDAGLARDGDPEATAELHSCRAGIRRVRGDMAGALEDYRTAHARATRAETRTAMLCRQALVLHRLGRGDEADKALDAAEEIADAIGLTGLTRAEIHEQRGNRAFVRGDRAACMRHHQASLAAAEATGDPRGIARGHGGIGDAAYAAGHFATAFSHFDKAIETAERAGLGLVREEYLFMRAFALFFADPGPRAHLLVDIAVDSAMQCGAARSEMIAREVRAEMRLSNDDIPGVEEDLDAIEALMSATGETRFALDVETLRAFVSVRRGDPAAARARVAPLLPQACNDAYVGGTIFGLATLCAEDIEARDAAIAAGMDCIGRGALAHAVIWFHSSVMERAMDDGDDALAQRHAALLSEVAAREPLGLVTLFTRTVELVTSPSDAAARAAHAEALRRACLSDMGRLMDGAVSHNAEA